MDNHADHKKLHFNADVSVEECKYFDAVYEKIVDEKESGQIGYYVLPETQEALVNEIYDFIAEHPLIKAGAHRKSRRRRHRRQLAGREGHRHDALATSKGATASVCTFWKTAIRFS